MFCLSEYLVIVLNMIYHNMGPSLLNQHRWQKSSPCWAGHHSVEYSIDNLKVIVILFSRLFFCIMMGLILICLSLILSDNFIFQEIESTSLVDTYNDQFKNSRQSDGTALVQSDTKFILLRNENEYYVCQKIIFLTRYCGYSKYELE